MKAIHGSHHGSKAFHRGLAEVPHSRYYGRGKFGRLFPTLPPLRLPGVPEEDLRANLLWLGSRGGPMDPAVPGSKDRPNKPIPAGLVFFGQFVDHDVTLDTTSSLERQVDAEAIENFRTPVLELDSVYGSGPEATPYFYQGDGKKLLIDQEDGRPQLPRNSRRSAIIGDPRNDENLIISRLQLAFLQFHNTVVDALGSGAEFEEAQRIVRWHYQWIVLHEFLPAIVGKKMIDDVYTGDCKGRGRLFFNWRNEPFIPVEFAVAAYRFGHSQVPGKLKVNEDFKVGGKDEVPIFDRNELGDSDPDDLSGFGARGARRYVDWKNLLATGDGVEQPSRRIDPVLSEPLFDLPFLPPNDPANPSSLPARNLLRGHTFGLPSGQAVACAMCIDPLAPKDLDEVKDQGFDRATPLFYYILKEAEVVAKGKHLGPVGGRIVAEVLVGLLEGDRRSFVRADPKWTPASEGLGTDESFELADLVTIAESGF